MTPSDFVIVDGVPRAVLGEALKSSAATIAYDAKKALRAAIVSLNCYSENPDNRMGMLPVPDKLELELVSVSAAVQEYRERYELATRIQAQALEMLADAEGDS